MQDKSLVCKDCSNDFVFSVRDQEFYVEKGFENQPQRCRDCRTQRKNARAPGGSKREAFPAICATCQTSTTLPFKPRGDRPVYCRECYATMTPAPSP